LIIDDGELPKDILAQFEQKASERSIAFFYFKKDTPGVCSSRNIGVREAKGDIVSFLDDDIVLDKDYFKHIETVFESDTLGRIGGAQGLIFEGQFNPPKGFKNRLYFFFEFVLGQRSLRFGKMLPSGFGKYQYKELDHNVKVDFLSGCSSYRREVFEAFSFDESLSLKGYGYREDVDFSNRVSQKYDLIYVAAAKLTHLLIPCARSSKESLGRQMALHHHYLFHRAFPQKTVIHYLSFFWSMSGLFWIRLLSWIAHPKQEKWNEIKGILHGCWTILKGERLLSEE